MPFMIIQRYCNLLTILHSFIVVNIKCDFFGFARDVTKTKKCNDDSNNRLQNTMWLSSFLQRTHQSVIHNLNKKRMLSGKRKQRMPTYKVKYSFQNGLSLLLTILVLLRCNGLLADMMQYGLIGPLTK